MRHNINFATRTYLTEQGCLELETPVLVKYTPGGARNFLKFIDAVLARNLRVNGFPGIEAKAPAAHRLDIAVELVDQRRRRQADAEPFRFVEHQPQILAHPVDREAEIEAALAHCFPPVLERPGLRRTLRDRFHHDGEIEAGVPRELDSFGERLQHAGDGDLVDHLGELPGAAVAFALVLAPSVDDIVSS